MIARLIFAAITLASGALAAPVLTNIQDVLYKADGTRFSGTLTISWNSFQAADNSTVVKQSTTVTVNDGNLKVQLVPSTTGTPAIFYAVTYNSDGRLQFRETWSVPTSALPLRVKDVRVNAPAPGGQSGPGPGQQTGEVEQADVIGLIADLEARPLKGPGYAPNRVALVNALGALESVLGADGDCVHVDGSTGPCGSSAPAFIDNESPTGLVDGSNAIFTLSATPDPVSSLVVYRNGLLMKEGADYTLSARNITFVSAAVPQAGDILQTSFRVAGSDPVTPQPFPTAQVLCNGVGGATNSTSLTSLGLCSIPAGVLSSGNRVEIKFSYQHVGSTSGFSAEVRWGGTSLMHRNAASSESSLVGRAEAGVFSTGAQLSVQSWGAVLTLANGVVNATDAYSGGLTIDFRGSLAQSGGDTLTLRNFTVVRLP